MYNFLKEKILDLLYGKKFEVTEEDFQRWTKVDKEDTKVLEEIDNYKIVAKYGSLYGEKRRLVINGRMHSTPTLGSV